MDLSGNYLVRCRSGDYATSFLPIFIPCFAVRSSSAHVGKIVILERFHCSLTKLINLD